MRTEEVYSLRCWRCEWEIELPCRAEHVCPHCKANFDIRFRDDDADPVCTHTTEVASEPAESAPNPTQTAQDATENCQ